MEAIKFQLINGQDGNPLPTIYTALVKPGETFINQNGVNLRRCKSMVIEVGDYRMQPRRIRKRSDGKWELTYGFPRGRSWSQGAFVTMIRVIEITSSNQAMDREKLKQIAGQYFKDQTGTEPDTLRFTYEEDGLKEYNLKTTVGERSFDIWMLPLHNRIRLTENKHEGTFAEAAELAGYDSSL